MISSHVGEKRGKNTGKVNWSQGTGRFNVRGYGTTGTGLLVRYCWYGTSSVTYFCACLFFFPGSNPLYSQMKMYCRLMSGGRRYGHSFRDLCLKFLLFLEVIFFFCPLPPPPPPQYLPPFSTSSCLIYSYFFIIIFFSLQEVIYLFICCNSPLTSYF